MRPVGSDDALVTHPEWERLVRFVSYVQHTNQSGKWDCWEWTGSKSDRGYGRVGRRGINRLAHRYAYQLVAGGLDRVMYVCHRCDNRVCIRPSHLFVGTHTDNMADMVRKGRQSKLPGEQNGRNKLTEVQAIEILSDTRGMDEIARSYQVGRTTIRDIKSGKIWPHLERDGGVFRRAIGKRANLNPNCPSGHPYSGGNLYVPPSGARVCRACTKIAQAKYKAKKQETQLECR